MADEARRARDQVDEKVRQLTQARKGGGARGGGACVRRGPPARRGCAGRQGRRGVLPARPSWATTFARGADNAGSGRLRAPALRALSRRRGDRHPARWLRAARCRRRPGQGTRRVRRRLRRIGAGAAHRRHVAHAEALPPSRVVGTRRRKRFSSRRSSRARADDAAAACRGAAIAGPRSGYSSAATVANTTRALLRGRRDDAASDRGRARFASLRTQ